MLFGEPARTQFDLHFQVAGIPVRVHPLFWLVSLVMGASGATGSDNAGALVLIWIGVVFVSILIHELGHSLMMRRFGQSSHIVLHMMGGLAIPDSASFGGRAARSPLNSILISAAGPGAGFLLAAIVVGLIYVAGGEISFPFESLGNLWTIHNIRNYYLYVLFHYLLYVNIFWGLVNLLPVYPLDGGQISREIFTLKDPWHGMVRSLWLSVFTSGAMAAVGAFYFSSIFMALMFGSLAFSSYQILQQFTGRGGGYGGGNPW